MISQKELQAFESRADRTNVYGEPQIVSELPNGRTLELTCKKAGMHRTEYHITARLLCAADEQPVNNGIAAQAEFRGFSMKEITEWAEHANSIKKNTLKEKKVKIFRVPVAYEMYGHVPVEAETEEEAVEKALQMIDYLPLPDDGEYVMGSFEVDPEGAVL